MTPQDLIAAFEEIAEAPEGVARLRELVLELAVRGRLVPHDPDDEPASVLLERIAAEKARLVAGKRTRERRALPPASGNAAPFELPNGWEWSRFTGVASIASNLVKPDRHQEVIHVAPNNIEKGTGRLLDCRTVGEDGVKSSKHKFLAGQILYSKIRPNLSKVVCVDFEGLCSADMYPIDPWVDRGYLHLQMLSQTFLAQVVSDDNRLAMPKVNKEQLGAVLISVPPLTEQKRIVDRVDELMGLLDKLEAARNTREATRTALRDAALAALQNADTPEKVEVAWNRIAERIHDLFTDPADIPPLRQTVLQLAVRGRLVPQDPDDEPVSANLLGREVVDDPPFYLPSNWAWVTAQDVRRDGTTITYGILKPVWVADGVPTVRVTEMKTGTIDAETLPQCDPDRAAKFTKTSLLPGDLLISKDGTIGKTAFVPPELEGGNITQHVLRFSVGKHVDRRFVRLVIDSPICQQWMAGETKGVALKGVNVRDFRRMPLPLPPLQEQQRIVARVDELMGFVDKLEERLGGMRAVQDAFAAAAVHHLD